MLTSELLATSAVADALGLTRQGVIDMMKRGEITPEMKLPVVNGTYLFSPAEVERVIAVRAKKAEAAK